MIENSAFYASAVVAVLIVGIAKGGLAGGIGMIGVPLMALTIGPIRAAAIMLPILMVMDGLAIRAYWQKWSSQHLIYLLPGALLGTLIGWSSFQYFSIDLLKLMVGLVALFYSTSFWWQRFLSTSKSPNRLSALLWGGLSGFTSFSIHAGGPPLHSYLLPKQLERTTFQATTVSFFFFVNWMKIGPYYLLDQLDFSNLITSLMLLPLAPIGIFLGTRIHNRLNTDIFFRIVYGCLFLIGLRLAYEGSTALY